MKPGERLVIHTDSYYTMGRAWGRSGKARTPAQNEKRKNAWLVDEVHKELRTHIERLGAGSILLRKVKGHSHVRSGPQFWNDIADTLAACGRDGGNPSTKLEKWRTQWRHPTAPPECEHGQAAHTPAVPAAPAAHASAHS